MNYLDYRLYVEHIPRNLTIRNDIYPFEYETIEPTETIYNADDYIASTTRPTCISIPIKVPSREPTQSSWNKTVHPVVAYRIYYTTDTILYGVNISIGVVIVCIIVVYFYKWYEKNRKKIRTNIEHIYATINTPPPDIENYNSDF